MAKLSDKLKQIRQERGLTQLQLAVMAGLASRTVQIAESGRKVSRQTTWRIASALDVAVSTIVVDESKNQRDGYLGLPWSVANHLKHSSAPKEGSHCRSEEEVCDVVAKMRENFREQIYRSGDHETQQVFRTLNEKLDRVYFRYEEHYVNLWRAVPESVLVDRVDGELAGVSVVIPMKKASFREFCRGEKSFIDIDASDMQPQSQYLMLDSVTEFSGRSMRPWYQLTQSLSFVTFSQIAMLSILPRRKDFEMASFSASPMNQKRLLAVGFAMKDTLMSEFGYQLCHFGTAPEEETSQRYANVTTMTHFAHLAKKFKSATLKQELVTRVLQLIKRHQHVGPASLLAG